MKIGKPRLLKEFCLDAGSWGVSSTIAAAVALGVGFWEHIHDRPISAFAFLCLSIPLFWSGAFLAWVKKQSAVRELQEKLQSLPRPKVAIGWTTTGKLALGQPTTLGDVALTNVGEVSAHNVRIIPDKTKPFWIEQIGKIDMITPHSSHCIGLRAMFRNGENEQELLGSRNDPIRLLAVQMKIEGQNPELVFVIEYDSFEGTARYRTPYCMVLNKASEPSFESINPEYL